MQNGLNNLISKIIKKRPSLFIPFVILFIFFLLLNCILFYSVRYLQAQLAGAACIQTQVQLSDKTIIEGKQHISLFLDIPPGLEVGDVNWIQRPYTQELLLPDEAGLFVRDLSTGRIVGQGLTEDELQFVFEKKHNAEITNSAKGSL